MASFSALFTLICSLLAISTHAFIGETLLPSWIRASLLRFQTVDNAKEDESVLLSTPEEPLLQRLKTVDVEKDPDTAHSIHAAIANVLQASEGQRQQFLFHLEAARDAAVRGSDSDTLLAAYIKLSDAYLDEGRPLDSQRELLAANKVLANHFGEHVAKLNRGRGRAKFELGFTDSALGYFEEAEKQAETPEDKVNIASDLALARACLGKGSDSLQSLHQALEVLKTSRTSSTFASMPKVVHTQLAADVHFRLAELLHSLQKTDLAKEHYTRAFSLREKLPSIKPERLVEIRKGLQNLEKGRAPEFRCPRLPRAPWEKVDPQDMNDASFIEKIQELILEGKHDLAEKELKAALRSHKTEGPYKTHDAAIALQMLGDLYRSQKAFSKAAKHFRQALTAITACCGVQHPSAKTALEGLRGVKDQLPYDEQRIAAAAMSRYFELLEKLGVSAGSSKEKEEIISLLSYSSPLIIS